VSARAGAGNVPACIDALRGPASNIDPVPRLAVRARMFSITTMWTALLRSKKSLAAGHHPDVNTGPGEKIPSLSKFTSLTTRFFLK